MAAHPNHQFLGNWHLESTEDDFDPAEMEFRPNGELLYSVSDGDKWQIMRLTYRIEGRHIITDQPSSPREERTEFQFDERGKLILKYDGAKTVFVRGVKRAPDV